MATKPESAPRTKSKAVVLGRSAATGGFVLAPAPSKKKGTVSKRRIEAAVKLTLAKSQ